MEQFQRWDQSGSQECPQGVHCPPLPFLAYWFLGKDSMRAVYGSKKGAEAPGITSIHKTKKDSLSYILKEISQKFFSSFPHKQISSCVVRELQWLIWTKEKVLLMFMASQGSRGGMWMIIWWTPPVATHTVNWSEVLNCDSYGQTSCIPHVQWWLNIRKSDIIYDTN